MIGVKLQALTAFFLNTGLMPSNTLDAYMEGGQLHPACKNIGNGILISRFEYTAIFSFEDCTVAPEILFSLLSAWLLEFDEERFHRNMETPSVVVDNVAGSKADVEFKIEFFEEIELVSDAQGIVPFMGETYTVQTVVNNVAESVAVGDSQERETDLEVVAPP